ncbi:MAG: UDP-N-acetylmuramoyl-L-alanine--D-glutamate ligase [Bdellovibrio sp.]|nr:UDP-N-acetylmuramoyl-L-alanine--D-glutamate ligase [Bdellovibrio sp.]
MSQTSLRNLKTPIAVIGLGKSGNSALNLLKAAGFSNGDLLTYDDKDLTAQFCQAADLAAKNPQTLVVSPGVPLATPWIQKLIQSGAHLTSEITLTASLLTSEKVIGITGSVGKSTVTSILGAGAVADDENSFVGGNLGTPFCHYGLSILSGKTPAKWVVLELSSYQLENCAGLVLDFSAITFLSPNHLERYESLEQYYNTKLKITQMTKNICVVNQSSPDAVQFSKLASCPVKLVNAQHNLSDEQKQKIALIGQHNHDNFAVAQELGKVAGFKPASLEQMYHFKGLSHRLENVGVVNGVTYVNDSKATAMDSVLVATEGCLEKVSANHTLHLLLGGKDKNLPWEQLSILKDEKKIQPVFFGACGDLAKEKSKLNGPTFKSLNAALDYVLSVEKTGDVVLLSPGGTSLDEFKNFEDRGQFFTKKVIRFAK